MSQSTQKSGARSVRNAEVTAAGRISDCLRHAYVGLKSRKIREHSKRGYVHHSERVVFFNRRGAQYLGSRIELQAGHTGHKIRHRLQRCGTSLLQHRFRIVDINYTVQTAGSNELTAWRHIERRARETSVIYGAIHTLSSIQIPHEHLAGVCILIKKKRKTCITPWKSCQRKKIRVIKFVRSRLPPCVIIDLLSGVNANVLHFEFILNVSISSFVALCNKCISRRFPRNAMNLPSGDTS